jgi:release factor glutamine methyltransferase
MRLLVLPGVLRPLSDGRLLASRMRDERLARGAGVLDMFTGSGALAVAAAQDGAAAVTASDLSRRAALNARINAALNRVDVEVVRGDLFAPLAGRRFDLVLANPPYVPSAEPELPSRGAALAWEGGLGGRAVIDRFCAQVGTHLLPGGSALIVQSSLTGEEQTVARLKAGGLSARVLARERGPLGPVVSERAAELERQGMLEPGAREEELLVIQGSRI